MFIISDGLIFICSYSTQIWTCELFVISFGNNRLTLHFITKPNRISITAKIAVIETKEDRKGWITDAEMP